MNLKGRKEKDKDGLKSILKYNNNIKKINKIHKTILNDNLNFFKLSH
jgi:hypothetical protein